MIFPAAGNNEKINLIKVKNEKKIYCRKFDGLLPICIARTGEKAVGFCCNTKFCIVTETWVG